MNVGKFNEGGGCGSGHSFPCEDGGPGSDGLFQIKSMFVVGSPMFMCSEMRQDVLCFAFKIV